MRDTTRERLICDLLDKHQRTVPHGKHACDVCTAFRNALDAEREQGKAPAHHLSPEEMRARGWD